MNLLLSKIIRSPLREQFDDLRELALRVTGNIIWPILLHASTDPSIYLQTAYPAEGPLTAIAGFGNIAVIATGFVLLIFIRGRVGVGATSEPVTSGRR